MDNSLLKTRFSTLSTPLVADACFRPKIPLRIALSGIQPIVPGMRVAGRMGPKLLDQHRSVLGSVFERYGGRVVKTMGDGFLVEFASAVQAVDCAV